MKAWGCAELDKGLKGIDRNGHSLQTGKEGCEYYGSPLQTSLRSGLRQDAFYEKSGCFLVEMFLTMGALKCARDHHVILRILISEGLIGQILQGGESGWSRRQKSRASLPRTSGCPKPEAETVEETPWKRLLRQRLKAATQGSNSRQLLEAVTKAETEVGTKAETEVEAPACNLGGTKAASLVLLVT